MQEDLHKKIQSIINLKIQKLDKKLKIFQILYFFMKIIIFSLNLTSFSLATYILLNYSSEFTNLKEKISNNNFGNWTLVLTLMLVLSFITNITILIINPLRRTEEYKKLFYEVKYFWFKFKLNPEYGIEKLKEDVKNSEKFYLSKKQIKKSDLFKILLEGKK